MATMPMAPGWLGRFIDEADPQLRRLRARQELVARGVASADIDDYVRSNNRRRRARIVRKWRTLRA